MTRSIGSVSAAALAASDPTEKSPPCAAATTARTSRALNDAARCARIDAGPRNARKPRGARAARGRARTTRPARTPTPRTPPPGRRHRPSARTHRNHRNHRNHRRGPCSPRGRRERTPRPRARWRRRGTPRRAPRPPPRRRRGNPGNSQTKNPPRAARPTRRAPKSSRGRAASDRAGTKGGSRTAGRRGPTRSPRARPRDRGPRRRRACCTGSSPARETRRARGRARVRAASESRRARAAGAVGGAGGVRESRREPPRRAPAPAPAPGARPVLARLRRRRPFLPFGPPLRLLREPPRAPADARGRELERGQRAPDVALRVFHNLRDHGGVRVDALGPRDREERLGHPLPRRRVEVHGGGAGRRHRRRRRARGELAARTVVTAVARIAGLLGQHDARGRARVAVQARERVQHAPPRVFGPRAREVLHQKHGRASGSRRVVILGAAAPADARRRARPVRFPRRGFALAFRRGRGDPDEPQGRVPRGSEEEGFEIVELGSVRHPGRGGVLVLLPQRRRGGAPPRTPLPNSRATRRSAADSPHPGGPTRTHARGAPGWSHARSHARSSSSFFFATTMSASDLRARRKGRGAGTEGQGAPGGGGGGERWGGGMKPTRPDPGGPRRRSVVVRSRRVGTRVAPPERMRSRYSARGVATGETRTWARVSSPRGRGHAGRRRERPRGREAGGVASTRPRAQRGPPRADVSGPGSGDARDSARCSRPRAPPSCADPPGRGRPGRRRHRLVAPRRHVARGGRGGPRCVRANTWDARRASPRPPRDADVC